MSAPLRIPRLGMTTTEATLLEWLVAPGTAVQPGDVIALIETDKVESELEAPAAGTLVPSGEPGQVYEVGALIGEIVP